MAQSLQRRHLVASASDDGTARLWAGPGLGACAGVICPAGGAPVCGAAFCAADGNLLALAAADCNAYVYDLRNTASPLATLAGHSRSVSYVRFLGARELVSASIDGSLALWDWEARRGAPMQGPNGCLGEGLDAGPAQRFRGHVNEKNFVGLAVLESERLLACGSETGAAVGYHTSWAAPLAVRSVSGGRAAACGEFVTAVCWRPGSAESAGEPVLAAALSDGDVRLLQLVSAA